MFLSLDLLFLSCLFLTVEGTTDDVLPPRNLSLRWINDFKAELSWIPPQHSMENCSYQVWSQDEELIENILEAKFSEFILMEGRTLCWNVTTHCDMGQSTNAKYCVSYPDLAVNLQCFSYAANRVNCTWSPSSNVEDLRFFYQLQSLYGIDEKIELQECSLYTGVGRTGCHLKVNTSHVIHILFNGTINNALVWNTFSKEPFTDVRPPPLKWNITKHGDKFNITWTPPEMFIPDSWSYTINYNICGKPQNLEVPESTSYVLARARHCPYCMTIKARSDYGSSPPTDEKCFDADRGLNVLVCLAIIIPLGIFCLATLTFVICWRKRKLLFPRIPVPRDSLSSIMDNNNKTNVFNQNTPMEEEEICIVTVLLDNQIGKSDCRNSSDENLHCL